MQEMWNIRFASNEQDFIYQFGVNKGHTLSYSKLNRCLFLSSDAKQLHHNISDYAYKGSVESFPGQATLRTELGWSRNRFITALDELREEGLISTDKKTRGNGLVYRIEPLHTIVPIIHSELVYMCKEGLSDFYQKVTKYKSSDLYMKAKDDPIQYKEDIYKYFKGEDVPVVYDEPDIPSKPSPKQESSKTQTSTPLPKVINKAVDKGVERTSVSSGRRRGRVTLESPVEDWGVTVFSKYFSKVYEEKFKKPYLPIKGDIPQIKRLMGIRDNELIKQYMDTFMGLDYFQTKTLRAFCSQFTQTALDGYMENGVLPGEEKKSNSDLDVDTQWAEGLEGLMGDD